MAREQSFDDGAEGAALAVAAVCERICQSLTRSVGFMGSRALLARALSRAQTEHPVLRGVSISSRSDIGLDGVARAARSHGASGVVAGLETVLSALFALLARLLGVDMVARLVALSVPMLSVPMGTAKEHER
jgi:hypothetical protein